MIKHTLIFGRDEEHHPEQHGTEEDWEIDTQRTIEEARELLDSCRRFEHFVFLKPECIVIENRELGCYTEFHGSPEEIAALGEGLTERLPPERVTSYWLDHLRHEHVEQ